MNYENKKFWLWSGKIDRSIAMKYYNYLENAHIVNSHDFYCKFDIGAIEKHSDFICKNCKINAFESIVNDLLTCDEAIIKKIIE